MSEVEKNLRKQVAAIQAELSALERKRWLDENAKHVGTFWKYRSSYSCPTKPSDYWWAYRQITSIPRGANHFTAFEFSIDCKGAIRVEHSRYALLSGWQLCTEREYLAAWKRLQSKIAKVPHA